MLIPTYPHHHNSNTTPAARWCAATDATPHSCASSQSGARRATDTGERAQVRHARRWRARSVGAGALARFVLSRSQPTTTAAPRWHCCLSESVFASFSPRRAVAGTDRRPERLPRARAIRRRGSRTRFEAVPPASRQRRISSSRARRPREDVCASAPWSAF